MRKISRANDVIAEDHLRKTLARTGPKGYKGADNKLLPKPKDSCFGNFAADKKKNAAPLVVEPLPVQADAERSGADARTTKGKSTPHLDT